jgi:hypothetical protein
VSTPPLLHRYFPLFPIAADRQLASSPTLTPPGTFAAEKDGMAKEKSGMMKDDKDKRKSNMSEGKMKMDDEMKVDDKKKQSFRPSIQTGRSSARPFGAASLARKNTRPYF